MFCTAHLWIRFYFTFPLKASRGLQRQNCSQQNSAWANTARSRIFREFLCENELLSKTILACLSGAQMASIHEIKNAKKSRDTAPLKGCFQNILVYGKILDCKVSNLRVRLVNNYCTSR